MIRRLLDRYAEQAVQTFSRMVSQSKRKGQSLPLLDSMIAATALHHGLTAVTRNTRDFRRAGVKVAAHRVTPAHHSACPKTRGDAWCPNARLFRQNSPLSILTVSRRKNCHATLLLPRISSRMTCRRVSAISAWCTDDFSVSLMSV